VLAKAIRAVQPIPTEDRAAVDVIEEDAESDRPLIAALTISKVRGGLPAPGFFGCARISPALTVRCYY